MARQHEGPPRRGGYSKLPTSTTVQFSERTLGILRLIAAQQHRSVGDVIREAIEGGGMARLDGFESAAEGFDRGKRAGSGGAKTSQRAAARRAV